jgi:hypothetical protein
MLEERRVAIEPVGAHLAVYGGAGQADALRGDHLVAVAVELVDPPADGPPLVSDRLDPRLGNPLGDIPT